MNDYENNYNNPEQEPEQVENQQPEPQPQPEQQFEPQQPPQPNYYNQSSQNYYNPYAYTNPAPVPKRNLNSGFKVFAFLLAFVNVLGDFCVQKRTTFRKENFQISKEWLFIPKSCCFW